MLRQLPEELDPGTRLSTEDGVAVITFPSERAQKIRLVTRDDHYAVSYTHLTLPTIYSV